MSLVVLRGPEFGAAFPIPEGESVVGRMADCDITLPDGTVSRKHARIVRSADGSLALHDMNSACGLYVNGAKVPSPYAVSPGDNVQFGAVVACVVAGDPGQETPMSVQPPVTDAVTQVASRRAFFPRLAAAFEDARERSRPLSIVAFDVDGLKDFNARNGHVAGDEMLRRLCERVQDRLPVDANLARWTAREFVILLRLPRARAAALALELRTAAKSERVTISAGVAELSATHQRPEDLVGEAILALRERAKAAGGDAVRTLD